MKLNSIGNILLKIFACVFTIVSLYLLHQIMEDYFL